MTASHDSKTLIEAASGCWDEIAAFAWQSFRLSGPGAVLVLAEDLLQSAAAGGSGLSMNYFARDDIPSGDDFRSLMDTYDPTGQVMLMVGTPEGEQVLMIEACDGQRARPDSFPGPPTAAQ